MKLSDFGYILPKELIAQYPLKMRDLARLMILDRESGAIKHSVFKNITDYLRKGDLLVLNDTRVVPARLSGFRLTGAKVEILLLNRKTGFTFNALIKPGRIRLKEKIIFDSGRIYAQLSAKNEITFHTKDLKDIYGHGLMPLPPYIKRDPQDLDKTYYQTVYARQDGSVAAPTAGLHFTQELIAGIGACGINIAYVTLHVGYATFKPVKCEDITMHAMEPEYFRVPQETIRLIDKTRSAGGRIFAVGTTALRTLETYASGCKEGYTDLFVYPGYKFKIVDCLLTNFHLPRTTLFILACAFAKEKFIKEAYQAAIDKKYRFYSYGDAMLIM